MTLKNAIGPEFRPRSVSAAGSCCIRSLISDAAIDLALRVIVELVPGWRFEPVTMIRLLELDSRIRPAQVVRSEEEILAIDDAAALSPTLRGFLDRFRSRVIWVRRQAAVPESVPTESHGWFQVSVEKPISEIVDELGSWARNNVAVSRDPFGGYARSDRRLTRREIEILDRLSKGDRYCDISQSLGVSIDTVRGHLRRLYPKLGVHCRTAAVAAYLGTGSQERGTVDLCIGGPTQGEPLCATR